MTPDPPAPADDPLARAEAALRRAPVPDGPSEVTLARALDAARVAEARPLPDPTRGSRTMLTLSKIAAAVILAVAALVRLIGPTPLGGTTAFAEATQKLRKAQTFTCRWTMELPGKPPIVMRLSYKEPGRMRIAAEAPEGPINVSDLAAGKILSLDPKAKTALLTEVHSYGFAGGQADMVARFRELAEHEGKSAGKATIDGVEAEGFRVQPNGQQATVWLDPKSPKVLRIDMPFRAGDQEGKNVFSELVLDPPLDDALFRLEPPEGYKLSKYKAPTVQGEEALARLLRLYAEHAEGAFPAKLDDWPDYDRKLAGDKFTGPTDPKLQDRVQMVVQTQMLLLESKGRWGYRPEGVKLGDREKLLFWYQPKGSDTHRALYGDLRFADLAADQVPKAEKE